MRRPFPLASASVRTILLAVLAVLGGWALEDSLEEVHDNYRSYRQSQDFSQRVQLSTHLLVAAQHLAYERGRIAVVLRGAPPISEGNRRFVGERRSLADTALDKALAHLDGVPESVYAEVLKGRQALLQLRPQVDRDAGLPLAARDASLAERWYDTAGVFILAIRAMVDRLTGEFPGGDATRLTLLAAATQELRITAGGEASRIAQALAAGQPPPAELHAYVHERRGREGLLWQQIEWMAEGVDIKALQESARDVKNHHLTVFRPLQDRALAALAVRRPGAVPLESLTSASLPTLDGISKLTILASEHAVRIARANTLGARKSLVQHVARAAFLVFLLLLAFRYVVRNVVGPLAQIDGNLRRMGSLQGGDAKGNEIERLQASAAQLELSIAAQQRAEREFRSLGDNLPDNVARWDAEGRYLYVNPTHQRTLGKAAGDLIGKRIGDVFPNTHMQVRMAIEQVIATGQAVLFVHQPVPDGKGGLRLHDVNLVPEFDGDGKLVGVLGIGRDMTEVYCMQEMLAVREREFRSLAENAPDYIARYDAQCRIVYLNPRLEALLGLTTAAVAGKMPFECLGDRYWTYLANLEKVLADGEPAEIFLTVPDGGVGEQYHHVRMTPERGADGAVSGVLAIGRDVTELTRSQRRQELLEHAVNASTDGVFMIDKSLCFVFVNDAACVSLGYSREELATMTPADIDPNVTRESVAEMMHETLVGAPSIFETQHRARDGRIFPVELSTSLLAFEGEKYILAVARDISERKRYEAELQRREQYQRTLLDNFPYFVWLKDENSRLLAANRQYARVARVADTAELEGKTDFDFFPRELAEKYVADDLAVMSEGAPKNVEEMYCDEYGEWCWMETWKSPLVVDGNVVGTVGCSRDISERKRWEEEQRRTAEFQNSLLQGIKDAGLQMMVIENGRVCYVADYDNAALFGFTPADIAAGPSFLDVVHPDDRARVADNYRRRLAGEAVASLYELGVVRADGTRRQHEVAVAAIPGSEPLRIITISRDVTERKLVEAAREAALGEAQRLARMRSAFLSQMSHELRTPLNGILGYAQLLLSSDTLSENQIEGLSIIQKSGDHLLALINDLLDHARMEADKLELNLTDIALGTFIDMIAGIVRVRAAEKRLEFTCDLAPGLPTVVRGDEQRLRQVLLNLLSNAIKFTDRGRVVLRVAHLQAGRTRFEVRDSGVGIPEDQCEVIFEAFRQVGDASRRGAGSGLGLAISRQLVRLMGGNITVESRVGEGSTFSFDVALGSGEAGYTAPHGEPLPTARPPDVPGEAMTVPPAGELETLLNLAQRGNMRNIREHAAHLLALDEGYRPFATRLEEMAKAYQSKAIVEFVEACRHEHLPERDN